MLFVIKMQKCSVGHVFVDFMHIIEVKAYGELCLTLSFLYSLIKG